MATLRCYREYSKCRELCKLKRAATQYALTLRGLQKVGAISSNH